MQRPVAWMPFLLDETGKANIDYDKCVSCGQCLVNGYPFVRLLINPRFSRLSELYSPVKKVYAAVAPCILLDSLVQKLLPESYVQPANLGFADVFE